METNTSPTTTNAAPNTGTALDPREAITAAMSLAVDTIDAASSDTTNQAAPTPCDDFNVGQLLFHLLAVGDRIAAMGEGLPAASVADSVAPEDGTTPVQHWGAALERSLAGWPQRPLDSTVEVPWGSLTAEQAAGVYTSEVLVHCWDLAVAIGASFDADSDVIAVAHSALLEQLPVDGRAEMWAASKAQLPAGFPWSDPFGEAVTISEGASPLDALVALSGRTPGWQPGV